MDSVETKLHKFTHIAKHTYVYCMSRVGSYKMTCKNLLSQIPAMQRYTVMRRKYFVKKHRDTCILK